LSHQPTISGKETIGIFVNTSGYSPEAYKHANQSTFPLILTVIEANSQSFPRALTHFVANPRAAELVPNLVIGHRYHQMQHDKKIVVLFFDGKELGGSEK
jgi:hypothetical protein